MTDEERTRLSKFLSFVLRHRPESIGLTLDGNGWAAVDELLHCAHVRGRPLTRADLEEVVATSPKRRFAMSEDGQRVRASQGHSLDVELGYAPAEPPEVLFHGTIVARLPAILDEGLKRMSRHHVHLSADAQTAAAVGARRGAPIVLRIAAAQMWRDGHVFYLSANGVWLTDRVPPRYISR